MNGGCTCAVLKVVVNPSFAAYKSPSYRVVPFVVKMLRAGLVLLMFAVFGKGEGCRTHTKCDNCSEVELRCSGLTSFPTLKDIPNNTRYL